VTTEGFVSAVAELADAAAAHEELAPGKIYAYRIAGGGIQLIDLTDDKYLDAPRRKRGAVVVRDAESFLAYWHKHRDDGSEVYANRSTMSVTGVLDAHTAAMARFGKHHVVLQLKFSDPFQIWSGRSGQWQSQVQFAEFIEDRRPDIREPAAADLLELAQTFQATTKASFKSSNLLKNGQRQLEYVEQIEASGGTGKLTIPDAFLLGLPIFEAATEAEPISARLRYRIQSSGLQMMFILDQLTTVVDAAFENVIAELNRGGGLAGESGDQVHEPIGAPILRGTPAA
jgi:uncharacterized protein YfdQ (DUF2303 family)